MLLRSVPYQRYSQSTNIGGYRYFFNGQEGDNEVFGEVASFTAEFWQYDSRLGRRWNIDPVFKAYESLYACFAGNPIRYNDLLGADTAFSDNQARRDFLMAYNTVNNRVKELESIIQNYNSQIADPNTKRKQHIINKKNNAEFELHEWENLQKDFSDIIKSKVVCHYSSDKSLLNEIEKGAITGGEIFGKGKEMTGNIYISIAAGYDDFVIHENRHINQIFNSTNNRPVLEVEREAYLYQEIYNPVRILQIMEGAKESQYPDRSTRPEYYSLDDAIKFLYEN